MKIVLNLKLREEEVVFKSTRIDFYKKKEIYAVFTVFMIILSMLRKEEQLYHKNIIVTRR